MPYAAPANAPASAAMESESPAVVAPRASAPTGSSA